MDALDKGVGIQLSVDRRVVVEEQELELQIPGSPRAQEAPDEHMPGLQEEH